MAAPDPGPLNAADAPVSARMARYEKRLREALVEARQMAGRAVQAGGEFLEASKERVQSAAEPARAPVKRMLTKISRINKKRKLAATDLEQAIEEVDLDWLDMDLARAQFDARNWMGHLRRITSVDYTTALFARYEETTSMPEVRSRWIDTLDGKNNLPNGDPARGLHDNINTIIKITSSVLEDPYWLKNPAAFYDDRDPITTLQTAWRGKKVKVLAAVLTDANDLAAMPHSPFWRLLFLSRLILEQFFSVFTVNEKPEPFMDLVRAVDAMTVSQTDLQTLHDLHKAAASRIEKEQYGGAVELGIWPAAEVFNQYQRHRVTLSHTMNGILTIIAAGVHIARWTWPRLLCQRFDAEIRAIADDPGDTYIIANEQLRMRQAAAAAPAPTEWKLCDLPAGPVDSYREVQGKMQSLREKFTQIFDNWHLEMWRTPFAVVNVDTDLGPADFDAAISYEQRFKAGIPAFLLEYFRALGFVQRGQEMVIRNEYLAHQLLLEVIHCVRSRRFVAGLEVILKNDAKQKRSQKEAMEKMLGPQEVQEFKEGKRAGPVITAVLHAVDSNADWKVFRKYTLEAAERLKEFWDVGIDKNKAPPAEEPQAAPAQPNQPQAMPEGWPKASMRSLLHGVVGKAFSQEWESAWVALEDAIRALAPKNQADFRPNRTRSSALAVWLRLAVVEPLIADAKMLYDILGKRYVTVYRMLKTQSFDAKVFDWANRQISWMEKVTILARHALKVDLFSGSRMQKTTERFSALYREWDVGRKETQSLKDEVGKKLEGMDARFATIGTNVANAPDVAEDLAAEEAKINNLTGPAQNLHQTLLLHGLATMFGYVTGTGLFVMIGDSKKHSYGQSMLESHGYDIASIPERMIESRTPAKAPAELEGIPVVGSPGTGTRVVGGALPFVVLNLAPFMASIGASLSEMAYKNLMSTSHTDPSRPGMVLLTVAMQLATLGMQGIVIANTMPAIAAAVGLGGLLMPFIALPAVSMLAITGFAYFSGDKRPWSHLIPMYLRRAIAGAQIATTISYFWRAVSLAGNPLPAQAIQQVAWDKMKGSPLYLLSLATSLVMTTTGLVGSVLALGTAVVGALWKGLVISIVRKIMGSASAVLRSGEKDATKGGRAEKKALKLPKKLLDESDLLAATVTVTIVFGAALLGSEALAMAALRAHYMVS